MSFTSVHDSKMMNGNSGDDVQMKEECDGSTQCRPNAAGDMKSNHLSNSEEASTISNGSNSPRSKPRSKTVLLESCGFEPVDEAALNDNLPTLQADENGIITIRLPFNLTVEMTHDENVRVIGKDFQMLSMKNGKQLGLIHPHGRILCNDYKVQAFFSERPIVRAINRHSQPEEQSSKQKPLGLPPPLPFIFGLESRPEAHQMKMRRRGGQNRRNRRAETLKGLEFRVLVCQEEIFFNSSNMSETIHLNTRKRPNKIAGLKFPEVRMDTLNKLMHPINDSKPTDNKKMAACQHLIARAKYERVDLNKKPLIQLVLGGITIRQYCQTGELEIFGPSGRYLHYAPNQMELTVRVQRIEMGCSNGGNGHLKFQRRHIHTSRSGIVVSDSKTVASVDNFGNFICY
ncbi:hypothetical protein M3Y96_00049200 [Aphelenchoides besseyi]|nr:hypothetical protein M3Y96_00049200 [Aphelenchoides besseyi]